MNKGTPPGSRSSSPVGSSSSPGTRSSSPGGRASSSGGRASSPGLSSAFRWSAREEDRGKRLDQIVSSYLKVPLAESAGLIDFGSVYVQGRIERDPSRIISGGEAISVTFPSHGPTRFFQIDPNRILYRDRFLLAYDKEAGIPSQQTPSDAYNNIYAALLRFLEKEGGPGRHAALHHRLDRETSGVMLFALEQKINKALGAAFQEKLIRKEYLAWVEGSPGSDRWTTDLGIAKIGNRYCAAPDGGGKNAVTEFRVLYRGRDESQGPSRMSGYGASLARPLSPVEGRDDHFSNGEVGSRMRVDQGTGADREAYHGEDREVFPVRKTDQSGHRAAGAPETRTLVLATPLTGRTHQIRIHLAAEGHPILGDRAHGGRQAKRLMLHAFRLVLLHPATRVPLTLEAPVPGDFPVPYGLEVPPAPRA